MENYISRIIFVWSLNVLKSGEIKVKIQDFENINDILKMAENKSLKRKRRSRRYDIKYKPRFERGLSTKRT